MVCGLLGILTACTLLSSSCQRLLSYTVDYCPSVIATVSDSLADGSGPTGRASTGSGSGAGSVMLKATVAPAALSLRK